MGIGPSLLQRAVCLNVGDKTIQLLEDTVFPFGVSNAFLNSIEEVATMQGKNDV